MGGNKKTRAKIRFTLPSKIASCLLKAKATMAAAVLCPTPFNVCQSSWQKGEGNFYSLNHLINERIPKPLSTTLAFYIEEEKLF